MANFTLTIDTDNAAFEDNWPDETARILLLLAERLRYGTAAADLHGQLLDGNGNTVGQWAWVDTLPDDGGPAPSIADEPYSWAELLNVLPNIGTGMEADLKVEGTIAGDKIRVWLARGDSAAGHPFDRTVYVEHGGQWEGGWRDAGHFDGAEPDPAPSDPVLARALELTRDAVWERS